MAKQSSYRDWLETEFSELIDGLDVDAQRKRYLKSRWLDQIVWTEGQAARARRRYHALRLITVIGALVVPALVTLDPADDALSDAVRIATWVVSLIVAERQSGTLAWTASKPVSRAAMWLSKWISASAMLAVTAGLVPFAATVVLVVALYGAPPIALVVGALVGIVAILVFFAALGLAAGTVMPGQAAIAATGFAFFALAPVVAALIPLPITPLLPTSILGWALEAASGAPVPWVTPFAWAAWTGTLVALSIRRMNRIEL